MIVFKFGTIVFDDAGRSERENAFALRGREKGPGIRRVVPWPGAYHVRQESRESAGHRECANKFPGNSTAPSVRPAEHRSSQTCAHHPTSASASCRSVAETRQRLAQGVVQNSAGKTSLSFEFCTRSACHLLF